MIVVVGVPAWRPGQPSGPAGRACEVALAAAAAGARAELVGRVGDDRPGDSLVIALARAGVGHAAVLRDPARPTPLRAAPAGDAAEEPFADPVPVPPAMPPSPGVAGGGGGAEGRADPGVGAYPKGRADPGVGAYPKGRADPGVRSDPGGDGAPRLEAADVALGLSYLTSFSVLVVADDAPRDVLRACVDGAAFAGARLVVLVTADEPPPAGLPEVATVLEAPGEDVAAFARLVGAYAAALDRGLEPAAAFDLALAGSWERPAAG